MVMKFIRERVLSGERLFGTWCNLGSSLTAEMAGTAGFDWVLIDLEHGAGDYGNLVHQLQAVAATNAAAIVRIAWNDSPRFKRVLDVGASGVMVPYVNSADEARAASRSMRYPPDGVRGVATLNRAASFGTDFPTYFRRANAELVTIVQIETREAVAASDSIAAVDGVDVLFVGPMDLSTSLAISDPFHDRTFLDTLETIAKAARSHGKAPGILVATEEQVALVAERGYTFVALGSDGGMVMNGMKQSISVLRAH